jgi:hypothetical protein
LELADRLTGLLQLPLDSSADVDPWMDACDEVQTWLDANALEVPHHLWHYFADPDIRAKDPSYRAYQEEAVRRFIRQLRGEEPLETKRPWWRFW